MQVHPAPPKPQERQIVINKEKVKIRENDVTKFKEPFTEHVKVSTFSQVSCRIRVTLESRGFPLFDLRFFFLTSVLHHTVLLGSVAV